MRKLLERICKNLVGIAYDDLTKAEKNIVDLLIGAKYIHRDGTNLRYTGDMTVAVYNKIGRSVVNGICSVCCRDYTPYRGLPEAVPNGPCPSDDCPSNSK